MKHRILVILFISYFFGFNHTYATKHCVEECSPISSYANQEKDNKASFIINEIQSANIDQFMDPSYNFGGWIELYNPYQTTASLNNLFISNNPAELKKSRIICASQQLYPGQFEQIWFGFNYDTPSQVNFNLDTDGGILYISNDRGEILLQQSYPPAISRTSYARQTDGGNIWGFTAEPTPKRSNRNAQYTSLRLNSPIIDTNSHLFTSPFDIHIQIPQGATLRYTLDGTVPDLQNGNDLLTDNMHIEQTTILRFRLFEEGKLPSPVVTRSYILKDKDIDLPVISIVTDERYLYDDQIGIFVRGTNGKPGNGQNSPCNWNMDWDRPCNIEYLTTDGDMVVNQEANIAVSGGWSRSSNPKSFKIKAKKKYDGHDFIPYPVFPSKPYLKNKTWQVRNGGNDLKCRIKDAAMQEIVLSSGLDIDAQACQPTVHYINGKYIGMLNIREPNNKDFAYANFGWDDDEIDHFTMGFYGYWQTRGTDEAFLKLYDLSAQASSPEIYEQILNLLDVDEFINYMAVHVYLGCEDYGHNNVKAFRPRIENGRFRFMLHDLDSSLGHTNSFDFLERLNYFTFHEHGSNAAKPKPDEIKFITIFFNMLKNRNFRKKFIDTYCLVSGSIFEPKRCTQIIDSLASQRELALSYEGLSPRQTANHMKSGLRNRQNKMIQTLRNYAPMNLYNAISTNVQLVSNNDKAHLSINDIPVPTNRFKGELFSPITLQANTPAGYKFLGWALTSEIKRKYIFTEDTSWNYYDQGSLDNTEWKTSGLGINWKNACAPMGYNTKHPEIKFNTILDYGSNAQDKRPTYYFYKEFELEELPTTSNPYTLHYAFDDGIVIYINGKEFVREMMPAGTINYQTFANSFADVEPTMGEINIPSSFLKLGKNVIAVEVHNIHEHSSDIYFSAQLSSIQPGENQPTAYLSTEEEFMLPIPHVESDTYNLTACYEPLNYTDNDYADVPVVINEISAFNSIYINDYNKKKDWIELYNTTNEPIDLEGMYLSDSRQNPKKYCIDSYNGLYDTKIEAHGYKIFWADSLFPNRDLHTNFSLSKTGGEVLLTSADETWSDTLIYEPHHEKCSIGRYPDGKSALYTMTLPTINESNRLTSYTLPFTEPLFPTGIEAVNDENSFQMEYMNHMLYIHGNDDTSISLFVYSIDGTCVMRQQVMCNTESVPLNHLSQGCYIVRAQDKVGNQQILKIMVTN